MALHVGLLGCGTIGSEIAASLDDGRVPDAALEAVYDTDAADAAALAESLRGDPTVAGSAADLLERSTIVVEAAGQSAVEATALDVLESGTDLLIMSVGALADASLRDAVLAAANDGPARLYAPSGAIAGLDAVKAANLAEELQSVSLTTRKPPSGLANAPYIVENDVDLSALEGPSVIFEGSATEAANAFPSNVNVAISLSLAGIGPDETAVTIVADPGAENNVHRIEAVGSAGRLETTVENVPSPTNPKTSYLAALSAIEKLRGITGPVSVGT